MSGFTRVKRVTDRWDEKVMDRIVGRDKIGTGYVSSVSEHSAQADDDVISQSLSEIFFGFTGEEYAGDSLPDINEPDPAEGDSSMYDFSDMSLESIKSILQGKRDSFGEGILALVLKALEVFSSLKSNRQILQRNVMAFLRTKGYNAAVCKTKWESSGGLTAGNYEFIDVIRPDTKRYFVDLDFASEFVIARPTNFYETLFGHLPRVFVGKTEDLKQILKLMSDTSRRSLKSKGLYLPPWRKHRFMQTKWLGLFRRTTNIFPATFCSDFPPLNCSPAVKCRTVGFQAAIGGGGQLFPETARTR